VHSNSRGNQIEKQYFTHALRVGIAGPVGCGKTTLIQCLCLAFSNRCSVAVIVNDMYTKEDADFLVQQGSISPERVRSVETGGYPHIAIREDISLNIEAIHELETAIPDLQVIFIESGGDNLAAAFSPELADVFIYMIDVAGGDKTPRKGGPGVVRSDLLILNKADLSANVGASLSTMDSDTSKMRSTRPFVFTNLRTGEGFSDVIKWFEGLLVKRGL
jgi:urease accessory protein